MVVGEKIFVLVEEFDKDVVGVFKNKDDIIKFMKQEYNPYNYTDRDDYDTDEDYQAEIDYQNTNLNSFEGIYNLGYYVIESTMYKEV